MLDYVRNNSLLRAIHSRVQEWVQPYPWRPYFNRHRILFVHIPKCGGTSVLTMLAGSGRIWRDHCTAEEYFKASPRRFREYYRFAAIRDPLERAYSTYRYLHAGGNKAEDLALHKLLIEAGGTFDVFVNMFLRDAYFHGHRLFWPQLNYLTVNGQLAIPNLVALENLDNFLGELATRLGTTNPQRMNASEGVGVPSEDVSRWMPEIRDIYSCDYDLLQSTLMVPEWSG